MTEQNFLQFLTPNLRKIGLKISEATLSQLDAFCRNMVSDPLYPSVSKISSPEEIATKHILDSLVPVSLPLPCWKGSGGIMDIGTGAGFPSIPLSIIMPDRKIIAVDSKGKAIDFVQRMKEQNALGNLFPTLARAEELGHSSDYREKMDLVVSRAVASVRILLELCLPLVKIGGYALFYKGPKLEGEIKEAANAMKVLGLSRNQISIFECHPPLLPFSRGFVCIHKLSAVPKKYPRENGIPATKPL